MYDCTGQYAGDNYNNYTLCVEPLPIHISRM